MFGKIFEQIYDSSIAEDWTLRVVFQDFIVLSDIDGIVNRTPEAISRRTNVPLEIVQKAIAKLEAPDPMSQSPEYEGRRLLRLDEHRPWGWQIVNYKRYRDIASDEQRREKTKERTRKWREKSTLQTGDAPVTHCDAGDAMQRQKQRYKEVPPKPPVTSVTPPPELPLVGGEGSKPKVWEPSPIQKRFNALFRRQPATKWTDKELKALKLIEPVPEADMQTVEAYYTASHPPDRDYRRRDLQTLLNNFAGELDRARRFKTAPKPQKAPFTGY